MLQYKSLRKGLVNFRCLQPPFVEGDIFVDHIWETPGSSLEADASLMHFCLFTSIVGVYASRSFRTYYSFKDCLSVFSRIRHYGQDFAGQQ